MSRRSLLFIFLLFTATLTPGAQGCGEDTATNMVTPTATVPASVDYSNSTADTARLLQDSSAAMKRVADSRLGVHFAYTSNVFGEAQLVIAQGEGDMVFPDRARVSSSVYLSEEPTVIELIAIGETIYIKSAETDNVWRRDVEGVLPPNPRNVWNYLDFARSSRNLGRTTLPNGVEAYQVQVEIDANLLATESMKYYSDPRIIALLQASRSNTVSATVWIGTTDLLVYKQTISTSNQTTGTGSEQILTFSGWGESTEIIQPCTVC
ncbi:MAG: LolA-like protein [Thermoleophilia bacterium]